jgi:hypothetical protein
VHVDVAADERAGVAASLLVRHIAATECIAVPSSAALPETSGTRDSRT